MTGAILTQFLPYILGGLAALAALVTAYFGGRKAASDKAKLKETITYIETRKRMDETNTPDNPDDADKWLRDRSKR